MVNHYDHHLISIASFLAATPTFDSRPQLRISTTALGGFSITLLLLGFSLTAISCLGSRSLLFSTERIFIPSILACLIGLLNIPYCFAITTRYVWTVPAIASTIGAAVATTLYVCLYFYARRRLSQLQSEHSKPSDNINLLRRPVSTTESNYHTEEYFRNHLENMYPTALRHAEPSSLKIPTPPPPPQLSDEIPTNENELQRRNMSALLYNPESHVYLTTDPFNRIDFVVDDTDTPGYCDPTGTNGFLSMRSLENPSWRRGDESWATNESREDRRREIEKGR
jgi:hypothetical protein